MQNPSPDSLRRKTENVLVAFVDLTKFSQTSSKLEDSEIASWMQEYYQNVIEIVHSKNGRVVKFIGDAALIVFSEQYAEQGILTLLDLKEKIDSWLANSGKKSRLEVKIHFGPVVIGQFGNSLMNWMDVIGKTVNTAAMLKEQPFCMTPQAFRVLSSEARKRFKKHTPAISYIRTLDRHS